MEEQESENQKLSQTRRPKTNGRRLFEPFAVTCHGYKGAVWNTLQNLHRNSG
jgi:hypothetical protein